MGMAFTLRPKPCDESVAPDRHVPPLNQRLCCVLERNAYCVLLGPTSPQLALHPPTSYHISPHLRRTVCLVKQNRAFLRTFLKKGFAGKSRESLRHRLCSNPLPRTTFSGPFSLRIRARLLAQIRFCLSDGSVSFECRRRSVIFFHWRTRHSRCAVTSPSEKESGPMEWTTPKHEEIDLNCEISSYANAEI